MFAKAAITGTLQAGTTTFDAEYLVVAGGGGGAVLHSGGGGAGGYRSSVTGESSGGGASAESALSIALGTAYTITVGAGGAGVPASYASDANKGNSSVFDTITSIGGGGGSIDALEPAGTIDGGSGGGGGAGPTAPGGLGTTGQGYAGGNGSNAGGSTYHGGGGGGAAEVGGNSTTSVKAGDGGDGVQSYITGSAVYRAGGGGGSSYITSHAGGTGGLGGGGNGGNGVAGAAGTANTGGGGGAGGGPSGASGAGGSGVVIIRVPSEVVAEFSAGVVYNYIPLDDFNVYEITAAGVSDTVTFSQGAVTTVGESLRFNDNDSAYLLRTPSSTSSQQKFTWSSWVKRASFTGSSAIQTLFNAGAIGAGAGDGFGFRDTQKFGLFFNGAVDANLITTAVFRDVSAWYHVVVSVDTTQTVASDRIKLYVNGAKITNFDTASYPSLNYNTQFFNVAGYGHSIGRGYISHFDGYLSDVYFIDGAALDPSRFGKQDADGIWQPITYTGSYGTNGFHLEFADNSTAAALGTDTSGNGNGYTPSGITTDDQVTDTPSVNYATWNGLDTGNLLADGNLQILAFGTSGWKFTRGAFSIPSGKWYWEASNAGANIQVGISERTTSLTTYFGQGAASFGYYNADGYLYRDNFYYAFGDTWGSGDVIGIAFDADTRELTFYKNNVSQGSYTVPEAEYFPAAAAFNSSVTHNFGQRPFVYTPPTGFQALNSANLPAPTITDGKEHFQPVLYTGNGASQTVRGLEFAPDMVWIKARSAGYDHQLHDTVRGTGSTLFPNLTQAQGAYNTLTAFLSNGFTVDGSTYLGTNGNGTTFVAWNWNAGGTTVTNTDGTITSQVRANPDAGFSIVTFTGTTSNQSVGHGLGVAPTVFIVKSRTSATNWWYYTTQVDGTMDYLVLNSTNTLANGTQSLPTSSVFYQNQVDSSVAYCFAEVDGFSKFGTYTGNGSSTDGPFVYTGFRPAFVIMKAHSAAYYWVMKDDKRAAAYNPVTGNLYPNDLLVEDTTATANIDLLANGFKLRGNYAGTNGSGVGYIFMAFAENPFKTARAR